MRLEQYWKFSLAVLLCTVTMQSFAQIEDTTSAADIKEIKHWDFDQDCFLHSIFMG